MAFSKLKALLRKAAERTVERLWDRIGELRSTFSERELRTSWPTKAMFQPDRIPL
jgi:hypothetical protein